MYEVTTILILIYQVEILTLIQLPKAKTTMQEFEVRQFDFKAFIPNHYKPHHLEDGWNGFFFSTLSSDKTAGNANMLYTRKISQGQEASFHPELALRFLQPSEAQKARTPGPPKLDCIISSLLLLCNWFL